MERAKSVVTLYPCAENFLCEYLIFVSANVHTDHEHNKPSGSNFLRGCVYTVHCTILPWEPFICYSPRGGGGRPIDERERERGGH